MVKASNCEMALMGTSTDLTSQQGEQPPLCLWKGSGRHLFANFPFSCVFLVCGCRLMLSLRKRMDKGRSD